MYSTAIVTSRQSTPEMSSLPPEILEDIAAGLTQWFHHAQRFLNFRATTDPYAIMVSEFMLQQTTVAAVEPFFARFLKSYPTVKSLARADEDDVMAHWAGLGYYRRARQLYAAAKVLVEKHNGTFPLSIAELEKLPGFGRYTAGAVISQAFDHPAPILEANTIRVFSRLAGIPGMIGETKFTSELWSVATHLVELSVSPRDFNRAAMELGALICRPKPLCHDCPVKIHCTAYNTQMTDAIPTPRPRKQTTDVKVLCLAIQDGDGKYYVRKIESGKWHAGLWEFPTTQLADGEAKHAIPLLADQIGIELSTAPYPLTEITYQVTHHRITCTVFHCHGKLCPSVQRVEQVRAGFKTLENIKKLPLGSAQKKLLRNLEKVFVK